MSLRTTATAALVWATLCWMLGAGESSPEPADDGEAIDMTEFMDHVGLPGIWHGKEVGAQDFFQSNSGIPTLPHFEGVMGTHGVYRFFNVAEQTAVMIGEGKHGLWRVQDNGHIREYLKAGQTGLRETDGDPNTVHDEYHLKIVTENYSSLIPEEGWSGYKYPDNPLSEDGYKNWVDLTIYHPKYNGKYDDHVPIDLPHYYCTMSQNEFPHTYNAWRYAVGQKGGNVVGPLGKRAGLDISELYTNVLRFKLFEDAGVWVNVGEGKGDLGKGSNGATMPLDAEAAKKFAQKVKYARVDSSTTEMEVYLIERPFFNKPYLFVTVVLGHGPDAGAYVRPHGTYWDQLIARGLTAGLTTVPQHYPTATVEGDGGAIQHRLLGLPVYGMHHPDQQTHGKRGGACPNRGGDWGRYPWGNSGAGWPTNYEEVTPICDAVVLDIKLWTNLDKCWDSPNFVSGAAGYEGETVIEYQADSNVYGAYTDPWLLSENAVNPYLMTLTEDGKLVGKDDDKPPVTVFKLDYLEPGFHQNFLPVSGLRKRSVRTQGADLLINPTSTEELSSTLTALKHIRDAVEANLEEACKTCKDPAECPECNADGGNSGSDHIEEVVACLKRNEGTCQDQCSWSPDGYCLPSEEEVKGCMKPYPGYDGDIEVWGLAKISGYGNRVKLFYVLEGLEIQKSGGIHVHTGTSCDDASTVGGHYWNEFGGFSSDPWNPSKYETDSDGVAIGEFVISDGSAFTYASNRGRTVVVHDSAGARIGCAVLDDAPCQDDPCDDAPGRKQCNKIEGCRWYTGIRKCMEHGSHPSNLVGCEVLGVKTCKTDPNCKWTGRNKSGHCHELGATECVHRPNRNACEKVAKCEWSDKKCSVRGDGAAPPTSSPI